MDGQRQSGSIHNHPYVVALLGGKREIAKVRTQSMRTSKALIAARWHVEQMLDESEAERVEAEIAEVEVPTTGILSTMDLLYLYE